MARRRQRIIEAATAVLTERGPAALPLDEIAERAGVSRRTVFNYFHSVEDLLVAVGADMLGGVIASLQVNAPAPSEVPDPHEAPPEAPQEALLDELARILQSAELVAAMVRITDALGTVRSDTRLLPLLRDAFLRIIDTLAAEARRRHPNVPGLDVDLLVSSLVAGVVTLYMHWSGTVGVVDTPVSRQLWAGLLEHLINRMRDGFVSPDSAPPPTHPNPNPAWNPTD